MRARLQAAGTYHVIAISGGNIAILVGLWLLALSLVGVSGRPAEVWEGVPVPEHAGRTAFLARARAAGAEIEVRARRHHRAR